MKEHPEKTALRIPSPKPRRESGQSGNFLKRQYLVSVSVMAAVVMSALEGTHAESLHSRFDRNLLSDIVYQVFTDEYDSAYTLCEGLIAAYPDNPSGYFFKAFSMMAQMTEEYEDLYQQEYFALLDSVEMLATNIYDTCESDCKAWCCWYRGNIWAYRSLWKARFGSFVSAYKLSTKARESYELGLQHDSTLLDLYAGLGAVHYWKSAKGGILRSLGVLTDERKKGIAELKLAAMSSILSRETAKKTLITVLSDYGQYDSAIVYAEDMLARYPNGKSFLWGISWAYYHKKDYLRAHEYFLQLRRRLLESPGNYYKLIECDAQIARCLEKLGQKERAAEWCKQNVLYLPSVSEIVRKKQRDNTEYLVRMRRR